MKGVLVIAHGSRAKETEATLETILSMVEKKLLGMNGRAACGVSGQPETIIEFAFMEFSDRTVEKGVAALAAKAVTEIKIVPYFLFMGVHLKEDIPNIVAECTVSYPDIKITMGEPLGVDERLSDILVDRIKGA